MGHQTRYSHGTGGSFGRSVEDCAQAGLLAGPIRAEKPCVPAGNAQELFVLFVELLEPFGLFRRQQPRSGLHRHELDVELFCKYALNVTSTGIKLNVKQTQLELYPFSLAELESPGVRPNNTNSILIFSTRLPSPHISR